MRGRGGLEKVRDGDGVVGPLPPRAAQSLLRRLLRGWEEGGEVDGLDIRRRGRSGPASASLLPCFCLGSHSSAACCQGLPPHPRARMRTLVLHAASAPCLCALPAVHGRDLYLRGSRPSHIRVTSKSCPGHVRVTTESCPSHVRVTSESQVSKRESRGCACLPPLPRPLLPVPLRLPARRAPRRRRRRRRHRGRPSSRLPRAVRFHPTFRLRLLRRRRRSSSGRISSSSSFLRAGECGVYEAVYASHTGLRPCQRVRHAAGPGFARPPGPRREALLRRNPPPPRPAPPQHLPHARVPRRSRAPPRNRRRRTPPPRSPRQPGHGRAGGRAGGRRGAPGLPKTKGWVFPIRNVTSESRPSHIRVTPDSRPSHVRVTSNSRPSHV